MTPAALPVKREAMTNASDTPAAGTASPSGVSSDTTVESGPDRPAPGPDSPAPRQPWLHEHVVCVHAPTIWVVPAHGAPASGVDGLYVADRRAVSLLDVKVDGEAPVPVSAGSADAAHARFVAVARAVADLRPDPAVTVVREYRAGADGGRQTLTLHNRLRRAVGVSVRVRTGTDLAAMGDVKAGRPAPALPAGVEPDGLSWQA